MTPAGLALVAGSVVADLPSALARLVVASVVAGLIGRLDWRADLVVAVVAFGPYLRSLAALALPLPAPLLLRASVGARRPSDREGKALAEAFGLVAGVTPPASVWVVDSLDENAWVIGSTLFVNRGLFESPHLVAVVAHEAGHLAAGDGRVALAAWWLPVRSLAWVAGRLIGTDSRSFAAGGRGVLRLPARALGALVLLFAGGAFPMLLRPLWAWYRRSRELAADLFAARLGHGAGLVEALSDWQVLDLATPWWVGRSHPYAEQRIDRLQQLR